MTQIPAIGPEVPRRGSRLLRFAGRGLLAVLGWRIEGELPNLPKFVIAVAPHTSNWDFVVGMAAMFALDLRLAFLGKHTLFVGPFAPVLRWLGGIPVDRRSAHGVVEEAVRAFGSSEARVLALAPEGTRTQVAQFKTGFLHIARGANVPVLLATLDARSRCVRLGPHFVPGTDVEEDRRRVEAHFRRLRVTT